MSNRKPRGNRHSGRADADPPPRHRRPRPGRVTRTGLPPGSLAGSSFESDSDGRSSVKGSGSGGSSGGKQQKPVLPDGQEWYHGLLPREDITRMLTRQGDFIVRQTETSPGLLGYVLSVCWDKKPRHIIIQQSDVQERMVYTLGEGKRTFETIIDLVKFYLRTSEPLPNSNYILMNPVPRQDWELRHEHIKLDKKLGEGAFGEVFLGMLVLNSQVPVPDPVKDSVKVFYSVWDCTQSDPLPVAVKRSNVSESLTKDDINKLIAEVRIMQKFEHENIVKLHGVAADKQPIMIVMELCNQGALNSYLRRHGTKTSIEDKYRWCLEAANGMSYLHDMTCLHKDLASRNCLLQSNKIKLADFGLSEMGTGRSKLGKGAKVPIRWLAPETMAKQYYDYKTDVWTYGILVWEIFTDADEPYPDLKTSEVIRKVSKEKYQMPIPGEWPRPVRHCIRMCWDHTPNQRPNFATISRHLKENM